MKSTKLKTVILICLVLLVLFACFLFINGKNSKPIQITYSLYPYLNNLEDVKAQVEESWKETDPSVELKYVDYDCYHKTPDDIDVFYYDVYCESEFVSDGYLQPIASEDITDINDIFPFALEGLKEDGKIYGIPALLCADFLIYHAEDPAFKRCVSTDDLLDCSNRMAVDNNCIYYYYLEALIDHNGDTDCIKDSNIAVNLDENAKKKLESLLSTCNSKITDNGIDAVIDAFNKNKIDGYIGFSESMSKISNLSDVDIKQISFYGKDNTEVFFCDAVGINGNINSDSRKYEKCLEFANFLASKELIKGTCLSKSGIQYSLPARLSVYDELSADYPLYEVLKDATQKGEGLFRLGSKANDTTSKLKSIFASD